MLACPYDANDKVAWLIKHQKFEEALEAVKDSNKFTTLEVGKSYIDYLILKKEYQKAGKLCQVILGNFYNWIVNEIASIANVCSRKYLYY